MVQINHLFGTNILFNKKQNKKIDLPQQNEMPLLSQRGDGDFLLILIVYCM